MYAKQHDILKLCSNRLHDIPHDIHYCPERLKGRLSPGQFQSLSGQPWYGALRHHCYLSWWHGPECQYNPSYPTSKEFLLITLADWLASSISRKLRCTGKKYWEVFKIWKDEVTKPPGNPPADDSIYQELAGGRDIITLFEEKKPDIIKRSEDIAHCPFASLLTHSELTEKWFNFLLKNSSYFGFPDQINNKNDARRFIIDALSLKSKKGKGLKPIFFARLKIIPNEKIARLSDIQIIADLEKLLALIPERVNYSQELHSLYDELVLALCPEGLADDENLEKLFKKSLEKEVQGIHEFTSNYSLEINLSKTYLTKAYKNDKNFLNNFDTLFGEFKQSLYPDLPPTIMPFQGSNEDSVSAAILCELCQLAQAQHPYYKEKRDIPRAKEHLCYSCYQLREQIEQETEEPRVKIGKDFAHWEDEEPTPDAGFIYLSLSMQKLNQILKDRFEKDFDLTRKIKPLREQDLGFSIINEFLLEYKSFVDEFRQEVLAQEQYTDKKNYVEILPNFLCLKMDSSAEIKPLIDKYIKKYIDFFPRWESAETPITLSISYGNVKFPFFEHWRYLNSVKKQPINIFLVRKTRLEMDFGKYEKLSKLDLGDRRISTFLHNMAAIEEKTGNDLLVKVSIIERRRAFAEGFPFFTRGEITAQDILSYYKVFKKPSLSEIYYASTAVF